MTLHIQLLTFLVDIVTRKRPYFTHILTVASIRSCLQGAWRTSSGRAMRGICYGPSRKREEHSRITWDDSFCDQKYASHILCSAQMQVTRIQVYKSGRETCDHVTGQS